MQDYKYNFSLYQLPLKGKGATESTRRARAVWLFPQTRELLPASHVSVASATLQQIVTDGGPPPRGSVNCHAKVPFQRHRRSQHAGRMQATRRGDGRRGQSGVGSAYMRIESLGNGNHLEAKSPRRQTDGRTRTERRGNADAVHDSALVSVVVAVADGRSSSIPDGGLKSETAPEPKSCQTG